MIGYRVGYRPFRGDGSGLDAIGLAALATPDTLPWSLPRRHAELDPDERCDVPA